MIKLKNIYTGRQTSFYGKAKINKKANGLELYSYNTLVAKAMGKPTNGKYHHLKLFPLWDYSMTTLGHIREFLVQFMTSNWLRKHHLLMPNKGTSNYYLNLSKSVLEKEFENA